MRLHEIVLPLLVSVTSSALFSACQTATSDSGARTGKTIQQAADEVDLGMRALDSTIASLNEMLERPAPDLSMQFDAYSKNLAALESHAANVSEIATDIDLNSRTYFAAWDAEIALITNEDIRERSKERRENLDESFEEMDEHYAKAREEFRPLLADLKDIQTALSADLTPKGVDVVRKTAERSAKRSEDVKETLADLAKEFRSLGVGFGQAATPVPASTPPQ